MISPEERIARFIREDCYDDPVLFSDVILRNTPLWSGEKNGVLGQKEWCKTVVDYRKLVIVTGHALGKSWWLSHVIEPWWCITRPNSLILIITPSYNLAVGQHFAGVLEACRGSITADGKWREPAIKIQIDPKIGGIGNPTLRFSNGSQIIAVSSDKPEKMQGLRKPGCLIISDESSGLNKTHWTAMMSIGADKMIHTGNPLHRNEFYQQYLLGLDYDGPPHLGVKTIQLSSLESPDAHLDFSPRLLASKTLINDYKLRYGESSPEYRCRVLAEWPSEDYEDLLTSSILEQSCSAVAREKAEYRRKNTPAHENERILSIDVGEGRGDSQTVICIRDKFGIIAMYAQQMSLAEAASKVQYLKQEYSLRESNIIYDGGGMTGVNFATELVKAGIIHATKYTGRQGEGGKEYADMRAACAYAMAYRLSRDPEENPFHIPGNLNCFADLIEELRELKRITLGDGRSALENREDLKDRIHRSPDHSDALSISFRPDAVKRAR